MAWRPGIGMAVPVGSSACSQRGGRLRGSGGIGPGRPRPYQPCRPLRALSPGGPLRSGRRRARRLAARPASSGAPVGEEPPERIPVGGPDLSHSSSAPHWGTPRSARSPGNPRERTPGRRSRGLPGDLADQGASVRTGRPPRGRSPARSPGRPGRRSGSGILAPPIVPHDGTASHMS